MVGKDIEKPLILFATASPILRMALQLDSESARITARYIRQLSFLNISPPPSRLVYHNRFLLFVVTHVKYMGDNYLKD